MAKKTLGRPSGPVEKEPVNVSIERPRAKKLRELAVKEQRTISVLVENALVETYGI
jgi:hypothetical protein